MPHNPASIVRLLYGERAQRNENALVITHCRADTRSRPVPYPPMQAPKRLASSPHTGGQAAASLRGCPGKGAPLACPESTAPGVGRAATPHMSTPFALWPDGPRSASLREESPIGCRRNMAVLDLQRIRPIVLLCCCSNERVGASKPNPGRKG
jgi:hypothetical protein